MMAAYLFLLTLAFASLVPLAASQSSNVFASNYNGFSGPSTWTNEPAAREGTVYGNNPASQYLYFAGGVELIANTPNKVYTDVWAIDVTGQQFIKAGVTLPNASYFGTGGWGYKTQSLWVHNGRTNVDGSAGNTYWNGLVQLSYAQSATRPTLKTVALDTPVDGRQYASSLIFTPPSFGFETMFVYGGLSGVNGTDVPSINFYAIALQSTNQTVAGTVYILTQTGSNLPQTASTSPVTSNPTMFVNPSNFDYLYFFGGLDVTGDKFGDSSKVFIYQISTRNWLTPTFPARSSYSAVSFIPDIVYSGTIITADFTQVLLLGGDYGVGNSAQNEVNGTHSNIFSIDVTPLSDDPTGGRPYFARLSYSLPYRTESPVSGLVSGTTVVSWSGSQYINEEQNTASGYVSGVVIATPSNSPNGNNGTSSSTGTTNNNGTNHNNAAARKSSMGAMAALAAVSLATAAICLM